MRSRGLVPWRRKSLLPSFFDMGLDVDDFFDAFSFHPMKTDLKETDKEYIVEADLPGYDKDGIEIRYEDNLLTINAKQDEITEEKNDTYIQRERRQGSFSRTFTIPSNVKSDEISASFKNGVLTVILPKITPSKPQGKIIDIE